MTWHPPVPRHVTDAAGTLFRVQRAWPDMSPGTYTLEVRSPQQRGVQAGFLSKGRFDAVTANDHRLPALAAESGKGELVVHRAHRRAVLRTPDGYIKVFRPGRASAAVANHRITAAVLSEGGFDAPHVISATADVLVFSRLEGQSFFELGRDRTGLTDAGFAAAWRRWSQAWTETLTAAGRPALESSLQQLPLRDAGKEARNMQVWVDHWLRHSEGIPEAGSARAVLLSQAEAVTAALLGSPPDPLGWAHGDLHDKQLLGGRDAFALSAGPGSLGLLDFDESCRAEVALDLANLEVHLELRWRQHRLTARRYAIAHSAVMSAVRSLRVSPHRFAAYAASTRLRLACLYSFRPPWGPHAASYLASPSAALPICDLPAPALPFPGLPFPTFPFPALPEQTSTGA